MTVNLNLKLNETLPVAANLKVPCKSPLCEAPTVTVDRPQHTASNPLDVAVSKLEAATWTSPSTREALLCAAFKCILLYASGRTSSISLVLLVVGSKGET